MSFNIANHIELLSLTQIKSHPDNPRVHSKKQINQIAESIRRFGFNVPLLIDAQHQLIAGHGRMEACRLLNLVEVPVIRIEHLSEVERRAFMIADNKLTENAEWDKELLALNFQELQLGNFDFQLDITGFEIAEIDMLLHPLQADDEPEEEVLLPTTKAVSKPSDLWLLGEHRLLCGNSLEDEAYKELLQEKKASLIFTDPPYNVPVDGHVGGLGKTKYREFAMASGEMSKAEFTDFLADIIRRLVTYSQDGSLHYLCMDWRHMEELLTAATPLYSEMKNLCVWVKNNGGMGSLYRSRHELVFVFKNGRGKHCNNIKLGQYGRYRTNVWEYAGANALAKSAEEKDAILHHPTVKPVAMIAEAILDASRPKEIVLDCFLGSGSTLMAAEKTGRRCYGIEIDPLYIDVAIRRWQKATGKAATHAVTGKEFSTLEAEANHE